MSRGWNKRPSKTEIIYGASKLPWYKELFHFHDWTFEDFDETDVENYPEDAGLWVSYYKCKVCDRKKEVY